MDDSSIYADWIAKNINYIISYTSIHFRPLFLFIRFPIQAFFDGAEYVLTSVYPWAFILILMVFCVVFASKKTAFGSGLAFSAIYFLGMWTNAMVTFALVLTAIVFCVMVGVPLGIVSARNDRFWGVLRPILDVMQTTPTFVYLVPVVMFFGIGTLPGAVAVVISALPPVIRFTNLGIRQVPGETIEAGLAFGATKRQLLLEVQLPLAAPTILAGLNQTVMMAMVMAVVASMIGAEGLGLVVLQALGILDVGRAALGGVGIILMAITLDRITHEIAAKRAARS